ncbi:inositol oxygenase-like isoform X2 [Hypomesus transpacificus]|uniref:inositol oxygenase-like isoform X2 n=1 Tax=Hypomesus transpacificus TaxID=137520 RepID=UPI001F081C21|nr:inositol oxygenase-like isoform X2 [Hypomesus transpacificus]
MCVCVYISCTTEQKLSVTERLASCWTDRYIGQFDSSPAKKSFLSHTSSSSGTTLLLNMRVVNLGPDPSLAYRPNLETDSKDQAEYRNFESGSLIDRVFNTYKLMHTNQTLDFVKQKHSDWSNCGHAQMGVMEAIMSLDQLVDESDPDVDFPNSFHAFQTAEGIRKEHPDKDWFQLVGLIHDIGKIMALWGEPQWAVVGDTFPVGCRFQNGIVFRDKTFLDNPDEENPAYNTKCGIYNSNCGLDNVLMSWGHDGSLYDPLPFLLPLAFPWRLHAPVQ